MIIPWVHVMNKGKPRRTPDHDYDISYRIHSTLVYSKYNGYYDSDSPVCTLDNGILEPNRSSFKFSYRIYKNDAKCIVKTIYGLGFIIFLTRDVLTIVNRTVITFHLRKYDWKND